MLRRSGVVHVGASTINCTCHSQFEVGCALSTSMMNGDRAISHRSVAKLVFRNAALNGHLVCQVAKSINCGIIVLHVVVLCPYALGHGVPDTISMPCRQPEARTIFIGPAAPLAVKDAMAVQTWTKSSFDVRALIGKTQVVWVYDAVCKHSRIQCALKCYRKESQSQINYQYASHYLRSRLEHLVMHVPQL